jgi:hypothetical protein
MADNVIVKNGSGADIPTATNEVAGVHYPKTKLADPRDGQAGAFGVPGNPMSTLADTDGPSNSTVTAVPVVSTAGGTVVLAANPNRRGYKLYNNGQANVFILDNNGAPSSSNFSDVIRPGQTLYGGIGCYKGTIEGIAASGTVSILATEYTP